MKNFLLSAGFLGASIMISQVSLILQISLFSIGVGIFILNVIGIDF